MLRLIASRDGATHREECSNRTKAIRAPSKTDTTNVPPDSCATEARGSPLALESALVSPVFARLTKPVIFRTAWTPVLLDTRALGIRRMVVLLY
mmetsp:Transcript_5611/g.12465  ORF Transcript_5611/g.12465 Transcript_5611/m.12465 type:complete len:94 (-) Transcript_5611:504-785(-)